MLTTQNIIPNRSDIIGPQQGPVNPVSGTQGGGFWGKDGFGFSDILDVINPLQHLPIVSDLYEQVTGDVSSPGSKVAGGALFGGVVGLLAGFVSSAIREMTGENFVENAVTTFSSSPYGKNTEVANNNQPPAEDIASSNDFSGPKYDTASYLKRYNAAYQLGQNSSQRINVAA